MGSVETMITHVIRVLVLYGFGFSLVLAGYGILRALRLSTNWVTWIMGSLVLAVSLATCLIIVLAPLFPAPTKSIGNTIGGLAFGIAVCAISQWIMRQWFLRIKKDAGQRLKQFSKDVLMFLRKHHTFFGLIVGVGSIAHMVFFLPILERFSLYEEVTGFIALGVLVVAAVLGTWLWIETTLRKRLVSKNVQTFHTILAITFFVALFLHL